MMMNATDVDDFNQELNKDLHSAVSRGAYKTIAFLKQRISLEDVKEAGGDDVLFEAAEKGDIKILTLFKEWGFTLEDLTSHEDFTELLLSSRTNVDLFNFLKEWGLTREDLPGTLLFIEAAGEGQVSVLEYLRDSWGFSLEEALEADKEQDPVDALTTAARWGEVPVLQFFKDWGVTLDQVRAAGRYPGEILSHLFGEGGSPEMLDLFRKWGITLEELMEKCDGALVSTALSFGVEGLKVFKEWGITRDQVAKALGPHCEELARENGSAIEPEVLQFIKETWNLE